MKARARRCLPSPASTPPRNPSSPAPLPRRRSERITTASSVASFLVTSTTATRITSAPAVPSRPTTTSAPPSCATSIGWRGTGSSAAWRRTPTTRYRDRICNRIRSSMSWGWRASPRGGSGWWCSMTPGTATSVRPGAGTSTSTTWPTGKDWGEKRILTSTGSTTGATGVTGMVMCSPGAIATSSPTTHRAAPIPPSTCVATPRGSIWASTCRRLRWRSATSWPNAGPSPPSPG
ncbi:hypothetical protein D3C81_1458610 [compost metagenome]